MSPMAGGINLPVRELSWLAAALAFCGVVLWLDVATSADFNECFLLPIAVAAAYPIRRDWATWLIVAVAVAMVVLGAVLEPEGESVNSMLVNRGVTVVVIFVIGLLMTRVTRSERQLFRIATTDPLTGILNRRHFLEQLGRERLRAMRYGTTVSLLILDIDHFKRINDTYGHPVGDEAIKALAGTAGKCLRPTDLIARFGGEEFVVMLPHTDEAGAVMAAERIREAVGKIVVPAGTQDVRFTVSIGATTHARGVTVDQLLECVDKALYAAKNGGRNQVCVGRLNDSGNGAASLAPA